MENKETRGLIDKKAYEDQLVAFAHAFFSSVLELSFYSPSHTLGHFEFSQSTLGGVWHIWDLEQEGKRKSRKEKEDNEIDSYSGFFLQVLSFMYGSLTSFGMHGICMCLFGYDFSLAWGITWIESGFAQPCYFLDSHVVVGFTFVFGLVFLCLWLWVELLVPRSLSYD